MKNLVWRNAPFTILINLLFILGLIMVLTSCEKEADSQLVSQDGHSIEQRSVDIESQFITTLTDLKDHFEDSNTNSNGQLATLIQENINSTSYVELYEIISTSALVDNQFVEGEVDELATLSLDIIEDFGEEYLEQIINTTGGPTIFDAKFWGKDNCLGQRDW